MFLRLVFCVKKTVATFKIYLKISVLTYELCPDQSSFVEGVITTANIIVMLFVICVGGWLGFRNGWAGYKGPDG
jgi:hypothetical protein